MKRFGPASVLLGLFCRALVQAQKSPPKALDQTVTYIDRPAQYTNDLPADYLDLAGLHDLVARG
jgi:hypothetical protein